MTGFVPVSPTEQVFRESGPTPVGQRSVYLHPGQLLVALVPTTIVTILGSCVAVSLFDPQLGIGGLNHFLLPQWADTSVSNTRFGAPAMRRLMEEMRLKGADPRRLEAKIFGGGCVLDAMRDSGSQLGEQNVLLARSFLDDWGVPVVASDTGGFRGRKLRFDTGSGEVWIRQV